ncbi:MAG: phage tail protein [Oscillospiraceae bacterium]|nr:phage tail protein [Oscillospiraceae bacterium]
MATIGTLGDIVFSVSRNTVRTFDGMRWESSAQYATHNRHLKDVLLEYTGTDADRITFNMYLSAFDGVNPSNELEKLVNAEREGRTMRLIIGNKPYGKHRWVIQRTTKPLERFDNKGILLVARVTVSLLAYSRR